MRQEVVSLIGSLEQYEAELLPLARNLVGRLRFDKEDRARLNRMIVCSTLGIPRANPTMSPDPEEDVIDEAVRMGGNALPRPEPIQLTDDDLRQALHSIRAKLRGDGLLLVSIRDYDQIASARPHGEGPKVFDRLEGRRIVFQVWDWTTDGRAYTINLFILQQEVQDGRSTSKWQVKQYATVYRALLRAELDALLREAGFSGIEWHMPKEGGYHQPIVTAKKA